MKKYGYRNKFLKLLIVLMLAFVPAVLFSGCARNIVGYHITSLPSKLVYQIGETPNFDGLKIERLNNDGTHYNLRYSKQNIQDVDTSTFGKKKVKVTIGNMSVAFNIYVANVVVNDSDNIKQIFESLSDGDIVYLRQGRYLPKSETDQSYKDVVINKSVSIVGDGKDKTKFGGNFIIGANFDGSVFSKIDNFKNVNIINVGFELKYKTKDGFVNYEGPYGKTDTNGALRTFDTQNMFVSNCSFVGYGYGILAENVNGLTVQNSSFRNIFKNAIRVTNDIKNSTIFNNTMLDIGNNMLVYEDDSLYHISAISLNFDGGGEKGVQICKNILSRIALHNAQSVYYDDSSKQSALLDKNDIFKMSYITNSSGISLFSSAEDDLEVFGVVISTNNINSTLENIYFGERGQNTVSSSGVIILD